MFTGPAGDDFTFSGQVPRNAESIGLDDKCRKRIETASNP